MIVEHLYANAFGSHVGKYSKRLKVTQGGNTLSEAPLLHLKSVIINSRGVSISADAIEACCQQGIPILFITDAGEPYASLHASGLTGTVLTRREQLLAYYDVRGTAIAGAVVASKIENQLATLKYLAKNRKESAPQLYDYLNEIALSLQDSFALVDQTIRKHESQPITTPLRDTLMGIEGYAARQYWEALATIIPSEYRWEGRKGRGATDPVNSLLNYGYGILYSRVEQAIILAGLDPYAGFLHTDRAGKPSLVLDLIEEFRQIVIDRLVIGLVARHYTIEQTPDGRLSDGIRKDYAEKVLAHLDATTRYQGARHQLGYTIQNQARMLASYLRGKTDRYIPFHATW
ncbi:MAG: CRISPR-associated endonuclease Cas1 [Phototrophicaceae bacterium]